MALVFRPSGGKNIDDPSALPLEIWQLFLQFKLAALGKTYRLRRNGVKTPETMRKQPPGLEEAYRATI